VGDAEMSNTVLLWGQIITIVVFVIALFVLYRLLVDQKEATIQLLKEKIDWLQKQLDSVKQESPDIVLKKLNDRVQIAQTEIERLSKDKEKMEAIQGFAKNIIRGQVNMIKAQKALIEALQEKIDVVENYHHQTRQVIDEYLARNSPSSDLGNSRTDSLQKTRS
jgi:predicted  nucleic acid-binding Zn-ribbon protein